MPLTVGLPFSDQRLSDLELAIRSVFHQTVDDWRLILISDGAPRSILSRVLEIDDPRVRVITHDSSEGLAVRLNEIARLSDTELLCRMDADDVMMPHRLERLELFFDQHPEIDLVGSRAFMIDDDNNVRGVFREGPLPGTAAAYLESNAFTHPTVAATTDWFRRHPYDEQLTRVQDKALWLASNGTSKFAKLDEVLLYYRVSERLSAKKQARSARYDRIVLGSFGPGLVGQWRTRILRLRSYTKQLVFAALLRIGMNEYLYGRRASVLAPDIADGAGETMRAISMQWVPGWDPVKVER